MKDNPRILAEQHWQWLEGLLDAMGEDTFSREVLRYVYVTAFIHGWKHAKEGNQGTEESLN